MQLLLVLGVGAAGGLTARALKIPAGAMIGAMIATAILGVAVGNLTYPPNLRVLTQVLSGLIIGCRFARADLVQLRRMAKPAVILIAMLLFFTVLFALLMIKTTSLDWMTALFSCAPGGVSDLALIAGELGANPEQVTLLQLFRFVFVVSFFPPFLARRFLTPMRAAGKIQSTDINPLPEPAHIASPLRMRSMWLAFSVAVALVGGYSFKALGVPAGAIIGALLFTAAANVATQKIHVPTMLRDAIQILAGCYIGSQITRHTLFSIEKLFLPMLLILIAVFFMSFITAWVLHRVTGLEFITCLFCGIPGGIAEMGLIADEMGLDTPKIVLMHTCRVMAVLCIFPVIARLLSTP